MENLSCNYTEASLWRVRRNKHMLHCPSLHITYIHHYPSLHITTNHYPSLHITAHNYKSLTITIHHHHPQGSPPLGEALSPQGPVVRTRVSANPGLNLNRGLFFFLSKALSSPPFWAEHLVPRALPPFGRST